MMKFKKVFVALAVFGILISMFREDWDNGKKEGETHGKIEYFSKRCL